MAFSLSREFVLNNINNHGFIKPKGLRILAKIITEENRCPCYYCKTPRGIELNSGKLKKKNNFKEEFLQLILEEVKE